MSDKMVCASRSGCGPVKVAMRRTSSGSQARDSQEAQAGTTTKDGVNWTNGEAGLVKDIWLKVFEICKRRHLGEMLACGGVCRAWREWILKLTESELFYQSPYYLNLTWVPFHEHAESLEAYISRRAQTLERIGLEVKARTTDPVAHLKRLMREISVCPNLRAFGVKLDYNPEIKELCYKSHKIRNLPQSLRTIDLKYCFPVGLEGPLPNLQKLALCCSPDIYQLEEVGQFTALEHLTLTAVSISENLQELTCLKKLTFIRLEGLPDIRPSLQACLKLMPELQQAELVVDQDMLGTISIDVLKTHPNAGVFVSLEAVTCDNGALCSILDTELIKDFTADNVSGLQTFCDEGGWRKMKSRSVEIRNVGEIHLDLKTVLSASNIENFRLSNCRELTFSNLDEATKGLLAEKIEVLGPTFVLSICMSLNEEFRDEDVRGLRNIGMHVYQVRRVTSEGQEVWVWLASTEPSQ